MRQGPAVMKDSFADFLTRLQAGDDTAARELFERFTRRLVGLARQRFADGLRHKVDPEDVVQSAYKSFFHRHAQGQLEVRGWDSLWGLLTVITVRKCLDRVAYHRAERRDLAREEAAPAGDAPAPWQEAFDREPTPLEAAELNDAVERLLTGLDEDERAVVELSLEGYSTREISERVGRAERTVRLLREGVRRRLERMQREN